MSASVLLVRHAAHGDLGERLSGRGPASGLTAAGEQQARRLGERLASMPLAAVQSSPRTRAMRTAQAIAARQGLEVEAVEALDEIDFGDWTGRRYDELDGDPAWAEWNERRATARALGGETMVEAQQRAARHVEEVARRHCGRAVAMVSHCDIIRALVAGALGLSLDRLLSLDVDPGSVSRLLVGEWGQRVASVNEGALA